MNRCLAKKQPRCGLGVWAWGEKDHRSPPDLPRRRRFPTSSGEQPAVDPAGVVSVASATAAGNFSSGQIDGALAAGLRGDQIRLAKCTENSANYTRGDLLKLET